MEEDSFAPPSETPTTTETNDYYDKNSAETSTVDGEEPQTTEAEESDETWGSTQSPGETQSVDQEEEKDRVNWILWVSVGAVAVTVCSIAYLVYSQLVTLKKVSNGEPAQQVVSFKK